VPAGPFLDLAQHRDAVGVPSQLQDRQEHDLLELAQKRSTHPNPTI